MIIYFSGTGNSRFVAERIAEFTKDELCDSSTYLRSGKRGDFTEAKSLVFVAPIYVDPPPMIFPDFIRKSDFSKNVPAWFIMTCAGSARGDAEYCRRIAQEKGRVCPLDNIRLKEGKPVWGSSCTHCMACINLCPKDAIEYGKGLVGKPRYKGTERSS